MKSTIIILLLLFFYSNNLFCQIGFNTNAKILSRNSDSINVEFAAFFNWGFGGQEDWLQGFNIKNSNDTIYLQLYYSTLNNPTGNFYAFCKDTITIQPVLVTANFLSFQSYWFTINQANVHDTFDNIAPDTTILLNPLLNIAPKYENQLALYPNPVQDKLVIQANDAIELVCIYNHYGVLVKKEKYCRAVDVKELSAGMYMLAIQTVNGVVCGKFLKD